MGADFICIWSEVSEEPEALREMVRHSPLSAIKELALQAGEEYIWECEVDDEDDEEGINEFYNSTYREFLIHAINVVHASDYGRDLAYIYHKGDKIVITGGLSWGDSPTDSYEDVMRYACIFDMSEKEASMTAQQAVDALNLGG